MADYRMRLSDGTTVLTDLAGFNLVSQAVGLIEGRRLVAIRARDEMEHAGYNLTINVDQVVWIRDANG